MPQHYHSVFYMLIWLWQSSMADKVENLILTLVNQSTWPGKGEAVYRRGRCIPLPRY